MADKKKFAGTVMTADVPNANGTIYPREVLEKAIEDAQDLVRTGSLYGSLNSTGRLELRKISHRVTKLGMQGDDVVAEVAVLATEEGLKLHRLVEMGEAMSLGGLPNKISMSPMGSMETDDDGAISEIHLTGVNISDDQK
jgi:hypothetical protein